MAGGRILAGVNHLPIIETIILPAFNNVVEGATAFLQLPTGIRYHRLHLAFGGTTFGPAQMAKIRLTANAELIQVFTGTERDTFNQFDKMQAAATKNVLTLPFERVLLDQPQARYFTAINTGLSGRGQQSRKGITDLRIEVDISGSTAPTLSAYAEVSDVNPEQSVALPRIDRWTENVAAVGEFLHTNSRRLIGDPLRPYVARLWFGDTNTNITNFRFSRNGQDFINRTSKLNEKIQSDWNYRSPQAGWVCYDSGEMGEYQRVIDGINIAQLDIRTTHAAVNAALPVTAETLGPANS